MFLSLWIGSALAHAEIEDHGQSAVPGMSCQECPAWHGDPAPGAEAEPQRSLRGRTAQAVEAAPDAVGVNHSLQSHGAGDN